MLRPPVLIQPINSTARTIITHANPSGPPALYEIWTVFFPLHPSTATVTSLEQIRGPIDLGLGTSQEDDLSHLGGFLARHHGWAYSHDRGRDGAVAFDESVEHAGQRARHMVYLFHWHDEEMQARYKRNMRWTSRDGTMVGCNAMKVFDALDSEEFRT